MPASGTAPQLAPLAQRFRQFLDVERFRQDIDRSVLAQLVQPARKITRHIRDFTNRRYARRGWLQSVTSYGTDYRPVLDALWATVGEDRLIYGSNWPVSENAVSYIQGPA